MDKLQLKVEKIKEKLGNCPDLKIRNLKINKSDISVIFLESTSSGDSISHYIVSSIADAKHGLFQNIVDTLNNNIANASLQISNKEQDIPFLLSSGFTIVLVESEENYIYLETKANLDRGIATSDSEPILRGPKDSFTENYSKNIGLIRKRIKDENLWIKEIKVGRRTKTKIGITYLKDVADEKTIKQIYKKLEQIDVDGIIDSGNLRNYLLENTSSFPQLQSTERPDIVCQALLNGKIVIIVENTPFTLIVPAVFIDFLHTSEDYFQKPLNVTFTRILKVFSFFITIFTPAIYIGIVTFNHTVVPDELLISLAVQREGVPFPTAFEIILLMTIFEILRESDIRMPTNSGTTMSIVGALVLGQAAVDAGIVSPIAVIVVAITSICGLIFTDADFINGIRFWRLIFIVLASVLGLIGVFIGTLLFIIKLCSLEAYEVSYLSPFAPFDKKAQKDALLLFPFSKIFNRPSYVTTKNNRRQS